MTQNDETPRGVTGASQKNLAAGGGGGLDAIVPQPLVTDQNDAGSSATTPAAGDPGVPEEQRQPGEWPPTPYADALRHQLQREQARRQLVLGSIRAHLEEQPTPRSVRTCERQWVMDITNLAETVVAAMSSTENSE